MGYESDAGVTLTHDASRGSQIHLPLRVYGGQTAVTGRRPRGAEFVARTTEEALTTSGHSKSGYTSKGLAFFESLALSLCWGYK